MSAIIPINSLTTPLPLDELFESCAPLEIEIGCGKGRFLTTRAQKNPQLRYLGIERMRARVGRVEKKIKRLQLKNVRILRLEAFYTFYYLLPVRSVRTVYVFFPDPWPKRHHRGRRLFEPLFIDTLCARLEVGGTIQIATDHAEYFTKIRETFAADARFIETEAMERAPDEQTEFEHIFRSQGLAIGQCAYQLCDTPIPRLPPLTIPPEMEPRANA